MSKVCSPCPRRSRAFIILLALVTGCFWLRAAPFNRQIQFTQPDGSVVQLWGQGDEFYAVFETLDGYTVAFDPALKAYCFANLSADGSQLLSTGVQVQSGNPQRLGLTPHLRLNPAAIRKQVSARYTRWDAAMGISERWRNLKASARQAEAAGPGAGPALAGFTTTGFKVGLTLLIDFDDDPASIPQAEIINFCNGDNYSTYGNNGSVKQYYSYVSSGKLTYTNVVTIYIRIPNSLHPKSYYCDVTKDAGNQANLLIKDALDIMKALPNYSTDILPTFAPLTMSGSQVLAFNVFYAGGNGNVWSMGLWPHSWGLYNVGPQDIGSGKQVFRYQISNIGNALEIGTFCHENGHMLCGYPDLYDYTGLSQGVGMYCLMAGGSWGGSGSNPGNNPSQICAYLKRVSGWANTIDLNSASSLVASITTLPGPNFNTFYRYAKPGTPTEYFLVECRYKTNHDNALPSSGALIWHIDELGDNSSVNLNTNAFHDNYEATVVQADDLWELELNRNQGNANDLYFQGNRAAAYSNEFTDSSAPDAHWWVGSPSGIILRGFSPASTTMLFVVGTNNPVPILNQQPADLTVIAGQSASFTVSATGIPVLTYQWAKNSVPIPGATNSTFSLTPAQAADDADYSATVGNDYGSVTTTNAHLTVIPTLPLPYALNNSNLTWATDNPLFWYGQANVSHDHIAAARSMAIGDSQHTALRTSVSGPGFLTFWWKVSSQAGDALAFSTSAGLLDPIQISGDTDWEQRSFYLPAGPQTLQWTYAKDEAGAAGADTAWVDEVTYAAGATLPSITAQPGSLSTLKGAPVSFAVSAFGTPPLTYQWRFNGANIPGADSPAFEVTAVAPADVGSYSVVISNNYGFALSSNALLSIVPILGVGNNDFAQCTIPLNCFGPVSIAAGAWHSLVVREDGSLLAWGHNWNGQCSIPANLGPVVAVAAGGYHSLALRPNRTVAGWGANDNGQATPPVNATNVIAVAAGAWHSLALRANGTVLPWGDNSMGQLNLPGGLTNVVAIAAGGNHSLALRRDGTVAGWGENTDPQGIWVGQSVPPAGLANVVAIAAGGYHSLAVKADGTVVGWGDNSLGQSQIPPGLTGVVAVAAGDWHSVALKADGTAVAWGCNWNGQCDFPPTLSGVIAIAAGSIHTLALEGDNTVAPFLRLPGRSGNQFSVVLQTFPGKTYALEYTPSLASSNWTPLPLLHGNGAQQFLLDPAANAPQRFYRVHQW